MNRYAKFGRVTNPRCIKDLDRAIHVFNQIDSGEHSNARIGDAMFQLGYCHLIRYVDAEDPKELDIFNASQHIWGSLSAKTTPMRMILVGLMAIAEILQLTSRPGDSARTFKLAVNLLPRLNLRLLSPRDQQQALKTFHGLASLAVAMTLESSSDLDEALTTLERGRGIIASILTEPRLDSTMLIEPAMLVDPGLSLKEKRARQAMVARQLVYNATMPRRKDAVVLPNSAIGDRFTTEARV